MKVNRESSAMIDRLSDAQWQQYEQQGYVMLGRLLDDEQVAAMQRRIDAIMLGEADVDYDRMVMQLEGEAGEYDQAGDQSRGFKKPTLYYRVVYGLEYDPLFLAYLQRAVFRHICERVYGPIDISTYRAFVMNKPAHGGSNLQWHQDRWNFLKPDPLITVWTALDAATAANGCVQIIPGSHRWGVINPDNPAGFLTTQQMAEHCEQAEQVHVELAAGDVALLHNWLLHRSGANESDQPRRGLSVCYMDRRTSDSRPAQQRVHVYDGADFPHVFGPGAMQPAQLH